MGQDMTEVSAALTLYVRNESGVYVRWAMHDAVRQVYMNKGF